MPLENNKQRPQDNSATEALIVSHERHAKSAGVQRDAIIRQSEKNNPVPALEAGIVQRERTNKSIDENGSKIADAIKELSPEVQKMHTIIEVAQTFLASVKGDTGDTGDTGDAGEKGDKGDQGEQGEIGPEGPRGQIGLTGPIGPQGKRGEKGLQGDKGDQGDQGPEGERGPAGAQGNDTADDIVRKLVSLKDDKRLSYAALRDAPNLENFRNFTAGAETQIWKNGVLFSNQVRVFDFTGSGATLTDLGGGRVGISVTGGTGAVTSVNGETGVVVLDTSVISDTTNKRYITDAQRTVLGNTSGTNTGDQTITLTGDVTGSGTGSFAATLATVNSNVGSFTNANITVDAKGRITAASSGSAGGSGITRSVNVISTPTTAGATALTDYVYLVSGTTTLTLPTAVSNTNRYTVKNVGSATITVAFTSAQNADGSTTISMPVKYQSLDFISDNTNWNII